jgi:SAM-dependent methyltransferase
MSRELPGTVASDPLDFEALFAQSDDPWKFKSRWYEARKRALTIACLPRRRFACAYEPGCANGELTAVLAPRCDRLLACDGASNAVKIARKRMANLDHVEVRCARIPDQWPKEEHFDLIVLSELAYYLQPSGLTETVARVRASLIVGGTVLACHWRPRIEGCAMDGDQVHDALNLQLGLPHLLAVRDADLRIDVWCEDPRSVAEREGLRESPSGSQP